ncbi:MAG: hypothetical protein K5853_01670 [Lachnospiraceae bacterium]|nr:hypothetical protein [Lachnospiraceae bacterium]
MKKQYALLMINMHPAYYRLKAVDSDFVAFDAEEEKKAESDFKAEWKRHEDYIAKCEKK